MLSEHCFLSFCDFFNLGFKDEIKNHELMAQLPVWWVRRIYYESIFLGLEGTKGPVILLWFNSICCIWVICSLFLSSWWFLTTWKIFWMALCSIYYWVDSNKGEVDNPGSGGFGQELTAEWSDRLVNIMIGIREKQYIYFLGDSNENKILEM